MTVTTKDTKEINASTIEGVDVVGPMMPGYDRILSAEAIAGGASSTTAMGQSTETAQFRDDEKAAELVPAE